MFLTDERLIHSTHLGEQRWNMSDNEESNSYFRNQAFENHMGVVIDAAGDLLVNAVVLGQTKGGGAHKHLVYGVARRAGDIRVSLRDIFRITPPDRTQSLDQNETDVVSRGLNTIYINVRGCLDNLAYAAVESHGGLDTLGLKPRHVDLWEARFLDSAAGAGLAAELGEFSPWVKDLAERRNPAAHRIPLSVIPTVVDVEQLAERQRLIRQMLAPLPDGEVDLDKRREEHEAIKAKIASIGTYSPQFAHDPLEGVIDIYPTVAEDVGTMIRIARMVLRHIG